MKNLLTILFLTCFSFLISAAEEAAYEFKAKFVMKNGESIIGTVCMYIEINDNRFCKDNDQAVYSDKNFQKLLNYYYFERRKQIKLEVLKSIKTVSYSGPDGFTYKYVYSDSNSVALLHLDSIKYTVFIKGNSMDRSFIGIFDSETDQMMQANRIVNVDEIDISMANNKLSTLGPGEGVTYLVLNFNAQYSKTAVEKKKKEIAKMIFAKELVYLKSNRIDKYEVLLKERPKYVDSIMRALWKEGIVLIPQSVYC